MQEKDSVAVYFVQVALHGLQGHPQQIASVLAEAGIDPQQLTDLSGRVSASAFAKLWLAVARELDDEFLGLDSHGMPMGSFALISRGLIQCSSIGQALEQCLKSLGLFLRDIRGNLCVRGKQAVIRLENRQQDRPASSDAEETFLTVVLGLLCWLAGRRLPISRSQFAHPRPAHGDDHLFWGPNLTFETTPTEIAFDSSYLRLPVVQDLASLKVFLRTSPQWLIVRFINRQGLSSQVFKQLRNCHYQHWPTLADMADERGLSIASFRRQLQREGFSFQELKDEVRRSIAFECLRNSAMSISDIAEKAGFREASAFHRAFKQWTGESPGHYRLSSQAKSNEDR
ncbi:AraC family transcriptional regulator [Pseudomonas sp.]|uniref:AraC family transcriptional regulator n=1 Tax=Pseudomonas sp. TaxID=306 RepID=UPI00299DE10A|nr:AraC family transcriptional regulator [Pseudomonas sp.]MDX1369986.1 AraC family transcriptional regulator [Pseudomonas sp.]MDX1725855.1 AraC family transcriptional regulator [Pseudomonas sp.]